MAPTRRSAGGSGRLMVAIEDGRVTRSKSVAAMLGIAEQHLLRCAMAQWLSHFHEHERLNTAMRSIIAMVGASRMAHANTRDLLWGVQRWSAHVGQQLEAIDKCKARIATRRSRKEHETVLLAFIALWRRNIAVRTPHGDDNSQESRATSHNASPVSTPERVPMQTSVGRMRPRRILSDTGDPPAAAPAFLHLRG